jgi:hypothetical protein
MIGMDEAGLAERPSADSRRPDDGDRAAERFLDRPEALRGDTDLLRRLNHSLFTEPEYRATVPSLRSLVTLAAAALLAVGAAALVGTAWHDLSGGGTTRQESR